MQKTRIMPLFFASGATGLIAGFLAAFLVASLLVGCGGEPEGLKRPGSAAPAATEEQSQDKSAPPSPPAPLRLSCQERQGRRYVPPKELPTWEDGMRVLVNNRCLPCHNRNFAAAGLRLTSYEQYQAAADSSVKRIANGLLKPLAAHESYRIQLWLLNGLPRSAADTADWPESRCAILP